MTGFFVTAIGTEIGKTHISCACLSRLVATGRTPLPIKPLMSGFDENQLEDSDAGRLLAACNMDVTPQSVATICMRRFTKPVAPNQAAREAGTPLDYDDILAFVNTRLLGAEGPVLVEGAGGVMSPVTDDRLHVDLIRDLAMPAFVVAANYLGAISHTLTALEALDKRSIPVLGLVVSQPQADAAPPHGLMEELERWTDIPLIAAPFAEPDRLDVVADAMIQRVR